MASNKQSQSPSDSDAEEASMEQLNHQLGNITISNRSNPGYVLRHRANVSRNNFSTLLHETTSELHATTMSRAQEQNENNVSLYEKPTCKNGSKCFNSECKSDHPSDWNPCQIGSNCEDFYCKANHPFNRKKCCRFERRCKNRNCKFLHPNSKVGECPSGNQCRVWQCSARHPATRLKDCPFGEACYNNTCQRPHPPTRAICTKGADCIEYNCSFNHPVGRKTQCNEGELCSNFYCADLHPLEWDPCEAGSNCNDASCPCFSHPVDRILNKEHNAENIILETQLSTVKPMKSIEQREIERKKAQLPILTAKDEFCQRLEKERVLVVTAETGSGKSTQLSQYAAEYFGGLVVCTQPRVIAAMSLAKRVAKEYDGISVGKSVGYRVGYASVGKDNYRIPGTDILFVTDAALVKEDQESGLLRNTRVLIIDEAHERSLYTDIVLGMAKILLKERPTDFYVVISSATVDPSKFLDYFGLTDDSILNVPGRQYDVHLENIPVPTRKVSIIEHAVSTLLDVYDQHQGHTLVFLPGAREIQQAIALFNCSLPEKCIALPLYAALSSEEINQVLQFDECRNNELRMVIFCTNIAETSVTINNVCLVIDSGLAKEPRFDNDRRLTIIETMKISRSSAEQRKGRAGRTAPGHCIRLYNTNELIRENIEPAIFRSSLDLVVLQIMCLYLDPKEFPFIDPPNSNIIERALDSLKDLSCIDHDENITERGLLFNELGFDPYYSAFLVDTYLEHGPILDLLATIIPILVTYGFRADMIGALPEEKTAAKNRVIDGAKTHDSDLLYLVSMFNGWCASGSINPETGTCQICRMSLVKGSSCAVCRAAYSNMYLFNNRSLCVIENIRDVIKKILTSPRWKLNPGLLNDLDESDILGNSLVRHFPERYGQILPYRTVQEDARMVKNDFRAKLSESSVFSYRKIVNPHFIAMSVVELSSGTHLIDQLHPYHPQSEANDQTKTTNDESEIKNKG